jgi:hypothetical protein
VHVSNTVLDDADGTNAFGRDAFGPNRGPVRRGDRLGGRIDGNRRWNFLTPLMLTGRWAEIKTVSAVSAGFILLNSIAGLLGNWRAIGSLPAITVRLFLLALFGGAIGSYWGA